MEACTCEIKSGWRPLFGALRAVKIEYTTNEEVNEARQRHVAAVLDVFDVFLNTDNELVFANAAVDCILCLLKYIRGPGMDFYAMIDDSLGHGYLNISFADPSLGIFLQLCRSFSGNIFAVGREKNKIIMALSSFIFLK